jgi:hypothetical protein
MHSRLAAALVIGFFVASPLASTAQTTDASPVEVPPDPGNTRLFLAPTARMLPPGVVSMTLLGPLPLLQVGITNRLSMGVGAFPISFEGGRPIILLMPKWQPYHADRTNAAVGALHFVGTGDATIGMVYGVITRGDGDHAVTAGAGWLYARDESSGGASPALIVGGEHRLGRHLKLMGDAYLARGGGIASAAMRVMATRFGTHFTVDLGMMFALADDEVLPFPAILLAWRF